MQRDIGNEFIVAIVAVGVLAFAVAFAIILSLSGGAGQAATATPQAIVGVLTLVNQTEVAKQTATEATAEITARIEASPTAVGLPVQL